MKKNKYWIRTTAIVLASTVLTGNTLSVFAAADNTEKDENIYVNLNQDGSVAGIYVVNEFELKEDSKIVDYGTYDEVRNLTTDSEIAISGNELSVNAPKGKFYYQGNLATKEMPWLISIQYYLDGEEIEAEDLAGKSGELKIVIGIKENTAVDNGFFDNYLVQATVNLNTEKCSNIKADGATAGNVGKNRQLLYNIMAGKRI